MATDEELKTAYKEAWSLKDNTSGLTYIGTVKKGIRLTVLYKDTAGGYWYETKYQTNYGIITAEEYIFGRTLTKGHAGKWKK